MSEPTSDRLLNPQEVADRLGIKVRTVKEWMRQGKLPAVKVGERGLLRLRESDLNAYIDALPKAGE